MNDTPRMLGDRYEVGGVLGRGGMAEVHLGRDTRLGRRVAIKMLRSDMARDPVFQARFRREAQSAAGLNHPAVVAVYDTGEDVYFESGGAQVRLPYIVMEHVEGQTLRDLLNAAGGHGLSTHEAVTITAGVLTALDYSHRQGIVHRDIKPANVMLTPAGAVKVMDFGIARAIADTSATMTQTSAVIGTAQYLSPEQARGETVDARTDLYSTGCLLYELLTGRPPFIGDSPVSVAYQHVREVPAPPSAYNPAVDDEIDRVVLKALAKDREDRYRDAEEFRADLVAAEEGRPVAAPAVAVATAGATQTLPTATEATRALAGAGFAGAGAAVGARTGATTALPAEPAGAPPGTTAGPSPAPERPRRRRGLVVLLVLLGLLLLAGAAWGVMRAVEASHRVTVPDVVNEDQQSAEAELASAGLTHVSEQEAAAPSDPGTVVAQSLRAGRQVDADTPLVLTVSTGPATVAVPDVGGQTESQARQNLANAGLTGGDVTTEADPTVPQGRVIRSDPAAGSQAKPGSAVNLVLASGQVQLPDLRGTTLEQAQQQLSALGLSFGSTTQPSDAPVGTVISQSPDTGLVDGDTTVQLVVAAPLPAPTTAPTPTDSPTDDDGQDDEDASPSSSSSPASSDSHPSSSSTSTKTSSSSSKGKGNGNG